MQASDTPATQAFTDSTYGYSIQVPTEWKRHQRTAPAEPPARLVLSTPTNSLLIVSIQRLPQSVTGPSEFESVGQNHVDPVVNAYRTSFGLTRVLGEQKDNQSDSSSLRFWQGTSAIHESMAPGMLISLHAISFGSDFLVNIVYASGTQSADELRAVDAMMRSLAFAPAPPPFAR
jgi:hypothetical protein